MAVRTNNFRELWVTIGEKGRYMGGKRGVMVGEKVEGYGWVKGGWLLVGKGEGYG